MQQQISRCAWAHQAPEDYTKYHDEEWGTPIYDDRLHFEYLTLESAQAGLSWLTVLRKRLGYRQAFEQFDVKKIAHFTPKDFDRLSKDPRIIRHQLKIQATISNAQCFLEIQAACGSFNQYIWHFLEGKPLVNNWRTAEEVPVNTNLSDLISKDLKQKGFKFLGSTTVYSYMQAVGLVNDHILTCFRHQQLI